MASFAPRRHPERSLLRDPVVHQPRVRHAARMGPVASHVPRVRAEAVHGLVGFVGDRRGRLPEASRPRREKNEKARF